MAIKRAIPSGYTDLDYIRATGTQYTLTDFTLKSSYRIQVTFRLSSTSYTSCIFCSRGTTTTDNSISLFYVTGSGLRIDIGSTQTVILSSVSTSSYYTILIEDNKVYYSTNGLTSKGLLYTYTGNEITTPSNVMLFASYYNGTTNNISNQGRVYLYEFKVWDKNKKMLHNLIPARQSTTLCLVDYETGSSFTNLGTGTFSYTAYKGAQTISFTNSSIISADIKKVIKDGVTIWCKTLTYARGTLPTGCSSFTCYVYSTQEPTSSARNFTSTSATIYYGDKLYWVATPASGYTCTTTYKNSSSLYTVTGSITNAVTTSGLTVTQAQTYNATITSLTKCVCGLGTSNTSASVWSKETAQTATLSVTSGTTVYAFVKLTEAINTRYVHSDWVLVSGTKGASGSIYRIASKTITSAYSFGSWHGRTLPKPSIDVWDDQENTLSFNVTNNDTQRLIIYVTCYAEDSSTDYSWYENFTINGGAYYENTIDYGAWIPDTQDLRYVSMTARVRVSDQSGLSGGWNDSPIASDSW